MISRRLPASLELVGEVVDLVATAAVQRARSAAKTYRTTRRRETYTALQPGPKTPLWNELASACERELTRYGDKARLARILGVPRQRVHLLLVAKTACPDAERTLLLLTWLQAKRRRKEPC